MAISEQAIRQALATVVPEEMGTDLVTAGCVAELQLQDDVLALAIRLGYPCQSRLAPLEADIRAALTALAPALQEIGRASCRERVSKFV